MKPGAIAMLAGGALILLSTFLDWLLIFSAYESLVFGFTGIILLILSLEIIAISAIRSFAPDVSLPDQILGFSMTDLVLMSGFASFVWGFSILFLNDIEVGPLLCAVGGIAVVGGVILEQKDEAAEPTRSI